MEIIPISKFKTTCLTVLDNVNRTGRSVIITRRGQPIAIIDPPPPPGKKPSWVGSFKSRGKIIGDILSPALPEKEWHTLND